MGIEIAEFPLTLEAARQAIELGMSTIGGSANSLRGESLSGNLCVNTAIRENLITALCSDYYPPAMIHAAFKLYRESMMDLPQAIHLVSTGPARVVGLHDCIGSIAVGKLADFLIVDDRSGIPKVLQTWVGGKLAHQSHQRNRAHFSPLHSENVSLSPA